MKITKKDTLLSLIDICIENGSALIVFTMNPNYSSPEITVIPYDNLEFKREYYKEFFTDELINKNNSDDKISYFTEVDNTENIYAALLKKQLDISNQLMNLLLQQS